MAAAPGGGVSLGVELVERGLVPDFVTRHGIRRLLAARLAQERARAGGSRDAWLERFVAELRASPVAVHTDAANAQHYEVPARFYELALGPHLKYSSCWFETAETPLGAAEAAMLALTCERAGIADGQHVLELGCGWGSLTLWMAEHYPTAEIVAVSNSASQREHVLARCRERGLANVRVVTCDVNVLDAERLAAAGGAPPFDRVVSVEMFEHVRNYAALLARIASWMTVDARLFVHVFCHREHAYPFETDGDDDWMARHFFTGGIMPSMDLLPRFDDDLLCERTWWVPGTHYARTAEAWLVNLDAARERARDVLAGVHGAAGADRALRRWRMFFLACAELFAWDGGDAWGVAHHLFRRRYAPGTA